MKPHALKLSVIACTFAAALLMSTSCAMAPRMDGPVLAAAGSHWTHERRDTGSYGNTTVQQTTRALGERTWNGRNVRAAEMAAGTRLSDAVNGDWLAIVKGDTTLMTWEPSLGYDWPLEVGKSFKRKFRFTNHVSKRSFDIEATITVQAYEDVTVPAGTFKAFRILYVEAPAGKPSWLENLSWFSPEVGTWVKSRAARNSNFPGGPGTQELSLLSYSIKL